jgi:aminopeptidase YwaD
LLRQNIERTIDDLLNIGPRAPGSWAELQAAEYLQSRFREMGYDAVIERFSAGSHNAESSALTVAGEGVVFPSLPLQFAKAGDVAGELLYLGRISTPLVTPEAVAGCIGLVFAGGGHATAVPYLLELERAGLRGLVVISAQMDAIETKNVRYPELSIPAVGVSWRTGNELAQHAGKETRISVTWCADPRPDESQNAVATLPGREDELLVVSAHHDSAAFAPGALDNASGTAVLLEVARELAGRQFSPTVMFVSTGSEENGGDDCCGAGAKAFYAAHGAPLNRIIGHVEIDDVGNLLGIPRMMYAGNRAFQETAFDSAVRRDFRLDASPSTSCDHGVALKLGLPYVFVCDACLTPRPCYHTPEDTPPFLDTAKCAWHVPYVVGMVERLAQAHPFYPSAVAGARVIRGARYADHPAIAEITEAAFGPFCMAMLEEEYFGEEIAGTPWHVRKGGSVLAGIRSRPLEAIVCEIEGSVVGYASSLLDYATGIARIGNNAVHPDHQGKGVGSAMQQEIARRMTAEGFTRFAVTTMTNDIPAQHVYEKLGYERVVGSVSYLKKGCDARAPGM